MYLQRNTVALSLNHTFCGKAVSNTHAECVSVALVIQHKSACAVLYCRLWPVFLYHIFLHYRIKGTIFGKIVTVFTRVIHSIAYFTLLIKYLKNFRYNQIYLRKIVSSHKSRTLNLDKQFWLKKVRELRE